MNEPQSPLYLVMVTDIPNDYKNLAMLFIADKTDTLTVTDWNILWNALTLAGEATKVETVVKNTVYNLEEWDRNKMIQLLRTTLMPLNALCYLFEVRMSDLI